MNWSLTLNEQAYTLQMNQYIQEKGVMEQCHLPSCLLKLYVIHGSCYTGNPSMFFSFKKTGTNVLH